MDLFSSLRIPIEHDLDLAAENCDFNPITRPKLIFKLRQGSGKQCQTVPCAFSAIQKQQNVIRCVYGSESADLLRNAVLQKFEIRSNQVCDGASMRIEDRNIE